MSGFPRKLPFLDKFLHKFIKPGENHVPYNWTFANATARTAAGNYTSADIGKLALQSDNNTIWMLIAINSTWVAVAGVYPVVIPIACSDETTALTVGTAKVSLLWPSNISITSVAAELTTAQTSGTIFTADVKVGGVSILSTKVTIDNTEKNTSTAATAPVLTSNPYAYTAFTEITIDISQIGDGTAKGLKVYIIGTAP